MRWTKEEVSEPFVAGLLVVLLVFPLTATVTTLTIPSRIDSQARQLDDAQKRSDERFDAEQARSDERFETERGMSEERFNNMLQQIDAERKRSDERFESIRKWLDETRAESKELMKLPLENRDSTRENNIRLDNLEKSSDGID